MAVGHERIMTADQESELMELRQEARDAEADFRDKHEIATNAKAVMKAAQDAVSAFLDDLANPTPRLPFGGDNGQADPLAGSGPTDAEPVPVAPSEDGEAYPVLAEDEAWKYVRFDQMSEYGIKPSDIGKLAEAEIHTMGAMTEWLTASPNRRLTDVPGIGEATADRISDACIKYHEAHPRQKAAGVPHNETSGEVDRLDLEPSSDASGEAVGDETGIADGSSDNTGLSPGKKPRRRRKAEAGERLPVCPDQETLDELERMHLEAGRPDAVDPADEEVD